MCGVRGSQQRQDLPFVKNYYFYYSEKTDIGLLTEAHSDPYKEWVVIDPNYKLDYSNWSNALIG